MSPPPAAVGLFLIGIGALLGGWILLDEGFRDPEPGDGAITVMALLVGFFMIMMGLLIVGAQQ